MAGLTNPSANEDIIDLCQKAFDDTSKDAEASQTALKAVANNLLLHEAMRPKFAASDYPFKVADRLQVLTMMSPLSRRTRNDDILGRGRGSPGRDDMLTNSLSPYLRRSLQI